MLSYYLSATGCLVCASDFITTDNQKMKTVKSLSFCEMFPLLNKNARCLP